MAHRSPEGGREVKERGVQPGYACPVKVGQNTPDRFAVRRAEIPGNGPLVDAALGGFFISRFNQYVPVPSAEAARPSH